MKKDMANEISSNKTKSSSTKDVSLQAKAVKPKKKKAGKAVILENLELLILTLPAVIYFFIINYIPMFGIVIAFKDFKYNKGIFGSEWNGIDNFKFFFTSQDAWRITRNTVGYGIVFLITGILAAVIVALLLFEIRKRWALKTYQTIMILPNFLSWVIVSYITYILLNPVLGVFNQIIAFFGGKGPDWYSDPKYWPYILTAVQTWKTVGMNSIMYYAALMGIDDSLFEAATIDGANKFQQILHVSIPALVPLMTILAIMNIGNVFRGDFGLFFQVTRDVGTLYPTTDIIDTYVYRGLRTGDPGITAAVGFFQSFVGMFMVFGTNAIIRKISPENAMF